MDAMGRWLIGGEEPTEEVTPSQKAVQKPSPAVFSTGLFEGKTSAQWHELARNEGPPASRRHLLCAIMADNDSIMEFPALFDLERRLVPEATLVKTKSTTYRSWVWRIGKGAEVTWFDPSQDRCGTRRRAKDAAKGYQVGSVRKRAEIRSGIDRRDRTYYYIAQVDDSPIEIVDDGSLGLAYRDRDALA